MKPEDLKRFENGTFKVELGKVDIYGCGRKENRVVLEFTLYQGKGTHRVSGEEYLGAINLVVYNRIESVMIMSVTPNYLHLPTLTQCGLNPLYYNYLKAANNLLLPHHLHFTKRVPLYVVAGIIDNLLMVEKIANSTLQNGKNKQKKH